MMDPIKSRKERSLGEMISSVSFYGLGIYAILEAMLLHEEVFRFSNVSQLALPA